MLIARRLASEHYLHVEFTNLRWSDRSWQPTGCFYIVLCEIKCIRLFTDSLQTLKHVQCNQELAFFRQNRGQPFPRPLYVCSHSTGHPCRPKQHICSRASKALPLFVLSQLEGDSIACERRTMPCSLRSEVHECIWIPMKFMCVCEWLCVSVATVYECGVCVLNSNNREQCCIQQMRGNKKMIAYKVWQTAYGFICCNSVKPHTCNHAHSESPERQI